MIVGFGLQNTGGSDESSQIALACAFKVVFMEMGLNVTNEQIARGTPCQTTLANHEFRVASECLMLVAREMNESGVKHYALSQDGGNKKGLEHLVKMVSYLSKDDEGRRRIINFCLDIDTCGKTRDAIVAGITQSLSRLNKLVTARCSAITGDSGGGGAVQGLHGPLIEAKAMLPWSTYIRCLLHALNKSFERAIRHRPSDG